MTTDGFRVQKMHTTSPTDDEFLAAVIADLDADHDTIRRDVENRIKDAALLDKCLKSLDALHAADKAEFVAAYCRGGMSAAVGRSVARDTNSVKAAVATVDRLWAHESKLRDASGKLRKVAEPFINELKK
jgi:hypothetical protein